jgi:hypothetical protein
VIFTVDGRDLVACDDTRCGAVTEVQFAAEEEWLLTRLSGPHYCPYAVDWRFRSLLGRAFGPPSA